MTDGPGPDDTIGDASSTVEVSNVAISFGDLPILEDVSLSATPGELVGLVGPNGAGKTTLLRTISGAIAPDRGSVAIGGDNVHDLSSRESSRRVAVVPQETTLSFSFSVRDVVEMGRHPYRSRFAPPDADDRAVVDDALERTRTAQFADRGIEEVSGGERQRVILARAIAQETPVLLLDEPTASLDVNHAIETLELVRELVEEGRTVIAAIHDLNLAARYCDRLVMLADGSVHRSGSPPEVLSAEALRTAFDANAAVTSNPVTGTSSVTALPDEDPGPLPDGVHVLGSGATASAVLARLDAADVEASLGPVSSGSTAAETAAQLGLEAIDVEPFAPLSRADRDALDRALSDRDVLVLVDLEIGAGNQVLLDRVLECESLVLVETRPFAERNFAGSGARDRYEEVRGRAVEASPDRVLEALASAAGPGGETVSERPTDVDDRAESTESASVESSDD
ncbi:heme ABC transporter ATP-binding protein [Halosolutus amylolyticus]|uniref:Cobalamin import ATP-binding protein BtuD n=1 Tax=Halosolutus amylolyticus TaxID=2932267 RepID=A0ABD5PMP5_9EURY|nr:heme ABC transporter ATP-binding protein [Halosolutus amylolyticus]